MIFVWALIVAAAAVGSGDGARIVGGELTTIDRYPSLVQVEFRNYLLFWGQNCAANVFTPRYLLTVAHCFEGFWFSIEARRLRVGSSFRNEGGTVVELSNYVVHPSYTEGNFNHDICVIEAAVPLTYSLGVRPLRLVTQGFELSTNTPVVHAGWGDIGVGGSGEWSHQLRHVEVYVVDQTLCANRYLQVGTNVTENMICTGVLNVSDRDTCEGDDGGPLYVNGYTLAGLISWGRSCGDPVYPRVNTKVSAYSNWIAQVMVSPEEQ